MKKSKRPVLKAYGVHFAIMLCLPFLTSVILAGPSAASLQGGLVWCLSLVALWLYIGFPLGGWGGVVMSIVGIFLFPLLLAKLGSVDRKKFWLSVAGNCVWAVASFFAARNLIESGLLM